MISFDINGIHGGGKWEYGNKSDAYWVWKDAAKARNGGKYD